MKIKANKKDFKKSSNLTHTQCTQVIQSSTPTAFGHGYFVISLPEVSLCGVTQKPISSFGFSWQLPFGVQKTIESLIIEREREIATKRIRKDEMQTCQR